MDRIDNPTPVFAPFIDEHCKFHPGDLVISRQTAERWKLEYELDVGMDANDVLLLGKPKYNAPPVGCVAEAIVQRCPGGVQIHYSVRFGDGSVHRFLEHELSRPDEVFGMQRERADRVRKAIREAEGRRGR